MALSPSDSDPCVESPSAYDTFVKKLCQLRSFVLIEKTFNFVPVFLSFG